MKYFITIKNNIITGYYYNNILPKDIEYIQIKEDNIDYAEISVGDNINDYNYLWKLKTPKEYKIISSPVQYFNNINNYTINFVEPIECVECNSKISIGLICCDKDFYICQKTVEKIQAWSFKNYEIIVVDNCENNNISFPSHIIHIKTNNNMFPFAGRQKIAEVASGDFLWYIDGDDNIIEPNLYWLNNKDADIISFYKEPDMMFKSIQVEDLLDYCLSNQLIDGTLHNTFFNKRIYKNVLKEWSKKVIWYYEDTFYLYYFLSKSKNYYIVDQQIYDYDISKGGAVFKIQNIDDLKRLCVNAKEMISILKTNVVGKYSRHLENQYYFGMEYFLGINDMIKYKEYLQSLFPFTTSNTKLRNEYSNYYIPPKETSKSIDIIYIYYGSNIQKEVDYLKSKVHCELNLIIIDYFNSFVSVFKDEILIKHTSFKRDLYEAFNHIKTNNIWILESYKNICHFDDRLIYNKTTVYANRNCLNKYLDFDCERNNIIFVKNDFKDFIEKVEDFQSLEMTIKNYIADIDDYPIWSILSTPAPFDEQNINYINDNNKYKYYKNCLFLGNDIVVYNKQDFLRFLSANLSFKTKNSYWYLDSFQNLQSIIVPNCIQDISDYSNIKYLIKNHQKVGVIDILKSSNIEHYKHIKYLITLSNNQYSVTNSGYNINLPYCIDYFNSIQLIRNILPKNKIIDLTLKIKNPNKTIFTVLPNENVPFIINECLKSWENIKDESISRKVYLFNDIKDAYLKNMDLSYYTEKEIYSLLINNIIDKNVNYEYIPYDTYFRNIFNKGFVVKPLFNISSLIYNEYYVFNIDIWNQYYEYIDYNFKDKIIVFNNTKKDYIKRPVNYISLPGNYIYFSELQYYIRYMLGNTYNITFYNIQSEKYMVDIINNILR